MKPTKIAGFTLIEMMVVVAVIAILAAIALPSFNNQVRKSRRAAAIANLQDVQLKLERWRVDHAAYAGTPSSYLPSSATDLTFYTYTLTADAATPNDYAVTAAPVGKQAQDACGTLVIAKSGALVTKSPATATCW